MAIMLQIAAQVGSTCRQEVNPDGRRADSVVKLRRLSACAVRSIASASPCRNSRCPTKRGAACLLFYQAEIFRMGN